MAVGCLPGLTSDVNYRMQRLSSSSSLSPPIEIHAVFAASRDEGQVKSLLSVLCFHS